MSNPFSYEFSDEFGVGSPVTSILIGGVEFITYCRQSATEIVVESGGRTSTAQLLAVVRSSEGTVSITPQMSVVIEGDEGILFSGYVSRVDPRVLSPQIVQYQVSCQDNTRDLDAILVASESYTSQTDVAIIEDLIDTYGGSPPVCTTAGVVGSSPPITLDSITFENLTLRQCLERICDRTNSEWSLGFDDDLKYYGIGSNDGEFDFSDAPSSPGEDYFLQADYGYTEEFSTPANSVTVTGYQAPKPDPVTSTLSISTGTDDGRVGCSDPSGATFPPGLTDTQVEATNEASVALQCTWEPATPESFYALALMRFNTAAIPDDAVITSAVLSLTMWQQAAESADLEFGIDYYAGTNWPITCATDFVNTPYEGSDSAARSAFDWKFAATLGLSTSATIPSQHNFTLLNPDSNISKSGYTGFRLYIGSASALSGKTNTIWVFLSEATRAGWRPTLTVTYQQQQQAPVTGSYTDAASVALYGTFEKSISDSNCTTTGECEDRARTECERYGYPRKSINCTFDRPGLNVGDTVHFTSSQLGIDDEFLVKKLRLRWPARQSDTRYSAELGEFKPDLIQYLRKL